MITLTDHKKLGIALITLLMAAPVALAFGQYLYLLENDIATSAWVQSSQGLAHNSTLEAWGLIPGEAPAPIYEDFTDPEWVVWYGNAGDISTTPDRMTWVYSRDDELDHVRPNHPNTTGGVFEGSMFFDMNVTYIENNSAGTVMVYPLAWCDFYRQDYRQIDAGNYEAYGIRIGASNAQGSTVYMSLWEIEEGSNFNSGITPLMDVGTEYYFNFTKTGLDLYLGIYEDKEYTVLFDELTLTLQANHPNLDYLTMPLGHDATGARISGGYIEDLTFGAPIGGYELEGTLYTEELLVNTTMGPAYTFSTSQAVPEGMGLTVEFSEDNTTWVRSTGLDTVTGNLHTSVYLEDLNYTALYARFSFTGDGSGTPSLESMDLTYLIDDPGEGSNGWIYALCASPVMLALGLLLRRASGLPG